MSKSTTENELLTRTILLGTMTGMRSMSAPALITRRAVQNPEAFRKTPFAPLVSEDVAKLAGMAAIGEMVIDKLPFLPKRTSPILLLGRAIWGGVVGAAAYVEARQPLAQGIAIGAMAAIVSSYVFYFLRRGVGKLLHLPDLPVALMEDAGVAALGRAVWKSYEA